VHGLIASQGLGQFYDMQEGGVAPAPSTVFQKRDYAWLQELSQTAEGVLTLDIQGLSCLGCAWLVERLFTRHPGALAIRVDPSMGRLEMRWQPGVFDVEAFAGQLQTFGYLVGPPGKGAPNADRGLTIRLGLCAALAMNTMLFTLPHYLGMEANFPFAPLFARLNFILGTLSILIGGSYFFVRSWKSVRQRVLHVDLPISLGLAAAYLGSVFAWMHGAAGFVYFDFVSTFTFLMLAGRWLQQKVVERNRRQLLAAQSELPAIRFASGEKVSVERIALFDRFFVEPGQVVPVSGRLHSERALLGMEWINGESEAHLSPRGRIVAAGAVNCGASAIELEAVGVWADSLLARLLRIAPASISRDPRAERFLRRYMVVVLALAFAGFGGWWAGTGHWLAALQVLISVLVVSCPCASGVALPLCRDLAASRLRALGVYLRDGELWSRLDSVRKVIFDKTGTLTLESISLLNPEVLQTLRDDERSILLALVLESRHPVSSCLREQLLARGCEPASLESVAETTGFGLETNLHEDTWRLGRAAWATEQSVSRTLLDSALDCLFTLNGEKVAEFRFGEVAREDAREEIAALQARGLQVWILSGDRTAKVRTMAGLLNVPAAHCLAELSPLEKAGQVRALDAHDTLYLGDGANDSLAFDAAWVSGTPAIDRGLLEQKAAFYFLGRGLQGVRSLFRIAALRRRTARSVVAFAIVYNAVAVALSLAGIMNPLLAAIFMPASSIVSLAIVLTSFGFRQRPPLSRL
jgi:Cu2+-exporting ATPase